MTAAASIAYRRDVALQGRAFGERDGGWLVVASALEHAAGAAPAVQKKLIVAAAKEARRILGTARVRRMAAFHWNGPANTPADAFLLLAYTVEDADALWLAESIVGNALRLGAVVPPLQRGRLLALQARLLQKLGHTEASQELYHRVSQLGRQLRNYELRARAANGLTTVAVYRGNHPLASKYRRQARRLAEKSGIRWLQHRAHLGLVTDAARRKDFASAAAEAWKMMRLSEDDDVMYASDMQTFGELLLHMGEPALARTILSHVVRRPLPGRILLPALGGFALAAARSGNIADVDWTLAQVRHLSAAVANRFQYTQVVVECAEALAVIGRTDAVRQWRDRALDLARRHRYHELVFRAEAIDTNAAPARQLASRTYTPSVNRILHRVRDMQPARLPARARLAPATAEV